MVRVLQSNYRLRGPPKSYASVVVSNVPGRHSELDIFSLSTNRIGI